MKKNLRKLVSLTIVFIMVLGGGTAAFASSGEVVETSTGTISVVPLTENCVLMSDGETSAVLNVTESDDEICFELREGSETNYLLFDKGTKQMYSSYTGKTISMVNSSTMDTRVIYPNEGTIGILAEGDIVESNTYRVSYAEIADMIGEAYSTYDLAVTIVAIIGVLQGVAITTIVAAVYGALKGALLTEILNGVKNKSSGGIKVTINLVEIRKHQGGRWVTGYAYELGSISTY